MGSENLNRIFIKAYGKASASAAAETNEADVNTDPLTIRFDTATVQIPAPHLLTPPRQPARVDAVQSPRGSEHNRSSLATASAREPRVSQSEPSSWDETMMSVLFGGSTMVAASTSISAERTQTIRNAQQSPIEPTPDRTPQVADSSAQENRSPRVIDGSQASSHNQALPNHFTAPARGEFSVAQEPIKPITAAAEPANQAHTKQSQYTNPKEALHQKIAALNQSGDIFRLDRPSYQDSNQRQSIDDLYSDDESSQTAYDIELNRTMNVSPAEPVRAQRQSNYNSTVVGPHGQQIEAASKRSVDSTRLREQNLRQSRIKIFNPLWEVDRLEWPAVCSELSRAIDEGSAAVVKNLLQASQAGLQVLAITSPQSGEGTSTVACCLAMVAGKHGLNVALVDSNIENPSLSYQANLDLEVDWNDAVSKRMPIEEVAVHSVDDQVTLVPLLERLNAPELNEQNIAMMLQELSQSFDLVIVDLGHMSAQPNMVRKLGELGVINAVVAVVDRRIGSSERIESCLRQIRLTGIASVGIVENFAA